MELALDDDGYLLMDGFSDEDGVEATGVEIFLPPAPLADSDWLAAVSRAVTSPLDGMAADDRRADDEGTEDLVVGEATGAGAAASTELGGAEGHGWPTPDVVGTSSGDVADAITDDSW